MCGRRRLRVRARDARTGIRSRRCLLVGGLTLALLVSAGAPAAQAKRLNLGAELRGLVRMPGGPPGAIAIVQRGRRRMVYRAGVRNVVSRRAIQPTDHMRIASTAKAFSGAVALSLVSRGKLSLAATIGRLLPWLPRS